MIYSYKQKRIIVKQAKSALILKVALIIALAFAYYSLAGNLIGWVGAVQGQF